MIEVAGVESVVHFLKPPWSNPQRVTVKISCNWSPLCCVMFLHLKRGHFRLSPYAVGVYRLESIDLTYGISQA